MWQEVLPEADNNGDFRYHGDVVIVQRIRQLHGNADWLSNPLNDLGL